MYLWTGVRKFLLYARRSEIRGVDIDNPYLNVIMALTVPDIDDVSAMDYDAVDERIYWTDVKTQTIKRAFINGTKLESILSGGTASSIVTVVISHSLHTFIDRTVRCVFTKKSFYLIIPYFAFLLSFGLQWFASIYNQQLVY